MEDNSFYKFSQAVNAVIDSPVTWFRKNLVEPNQKDYPWYHRQFRRVPTIDECYTDDVVCRYEAHEQFKRDKSVDDSIVSILRRRVKDCMIYQGHDAPEKCALVIEDYEQAVTNWFTKYGDQGVYKDVLSAFMRQKHRMVWERRYGPVGTGMTPAAERP